MIIYLQNHEIDYDRWDSCVSSSDNRLIYAFSWYLDLVCGDWDALVYNDYEAVFPLPKRRKWSIEYIYQPFFCQQLGVFTKEKNLQIDSFLDALPKAFKYIELNLNVNTSNFYFKKNTNYELLLTSGYQDSFSKNTKRNIKKANSHQLIFSDSIIIEEHLDYLKYYKKTIGLQKNDLETYSKLCYYLINNKKGKIYGVYNSNNHLIATALIAFDNNRLYYLNGLTHREGKECGAMHWLLFNIMQLFPNSIIDFEGSNIRGIARFYQGFGASVTNYSTIKINKLPFFLKWLKS